MEKNLSNLVMDGLDSISLDLDSLKQMKADSISEYARFTNFLLIEDNLDNIQDKKIKLKDFMENDFLTNFSKGFELAITNKRCEDEHINKISETIKIVTNGGYLNKDMHNIKMDNPDSNFVTKTLF